MKMWTYDCEVLAHDWLVVFKELNDSDEQNWMIIPNNPTALARFVTEDDIYFGFNSKNYDQFIIKAILAGFDQEDVKLLNDHIIGGGNGWDYLSFMRVGYIPFNNVDIMTDMQKGLSLKSIEGHLGMSIKESDVPFDLPRPMTEAEMQQTIAYCKHDVLATQQIIKLRKGYLETKINIGKLAGLDMKTSLGMTNAKLTAAMLKAHARPHDDERDYQIPANLKREYIPQEVLDFFDRMHDKSIPDEQVFKSKLKLMIGDCEATIGYGGIHAAIPHYIWKEEDHDNPTVGTV